MITRTYLTVLLAFLSATSQCWAWTTGNARAALSPKQQPRLFALPQSQSDDHDDSMLHLPTYHQGSSPSSRRQWLTGVITAASASTLVGLTPPAAIAVDIPSSTALCDPTVSIYERNGRLIYLLGTAHISSVSAELAGKLVRDTHPDAVFVELDLKRIGGSSTMAKQMEANGQQLTISAQGDTDSKPSRVMLSPVGRTTTPTPVTSSSTAVAVEESTTTTAPVFPAAPATPKGGGGGGGLLNSLGAAAVGKAIRGMYSKLGSEGFNPGEEFIVAIKEGQKQGSAIVLGDQDVDVTLKRMAQAIQKTDLSRLLNPDSELEQSMREMLPTSSSSTSGMTESEAFKTEMSAFVETMKTKENVKRVMGLMQQEAPYLYEVMVQERDTYMAAGLNTLNEFTIITAVMGLAHLDGVERNLQSEGWRPVKARCPQHR